MLNMTYPRLQPHIVSESTPAITDQARGSSAEAYWPEFRNAVLGHPSDLWNSFMSKPGTTPVEMEL
jgi:hypothetical protein